MSYRYSAVSKNQLKTFLIAWTQLTIETLEEQHPYEANFFLKLNIFSAPPSVAIIGVALVFMVALTFRVFILPNIDAECFSEFRKILYDRKNKIES